MQVIFLKLFTFALLNIMGRIIDNAQISHNAPCKLLAVRCWMCDKSRPESEICLLIKNQLLKTVKNEKEKRLTHQTHNEILETSELFEKQKETFKIYI